MENECTEKEEDLEDMECTEEETITIQRKEMENLQDLLVQTGQENEMLKKKVKNLEDKSTKNQ